ncbi:MAG: asparaginase [Micromonosporaceae bacterium]
MLADSRTGRVVVFGTGGTIAMTHSSSSGGGVSPALTAADLVAAVPGLAETGIAVDVVEFRRLPGASLELTDLLALSEAIDDVMASGADGAVVIQGTDTIEETSYLMDLYHAGDQPVVFTGAMRNATMAGADGPANLLAAVQTAASAAAIARGTLVVLADEIHAARRVRKTHTTSGSTFQSPSGGPLGYMVEGRPAFLNAVPARYHVPRDRTRSPRVALVPVTLGDHGELLDGLADRVDGLVVAAMGVGHVPRRLVDTLETTAQRIPVILASRTGAGSVATSTYGFPGSESDLISRGLTPAGFLDPLKARILLYAALAAGADQAAVRDVFALAGGYQTSAKWPWS